MSLDIFDIEVNDYYVNDDDDDYDNTCPLFCALLFYDFFALRRLAN